MNNCSPVRWATPYCMPVFLQEKKNFISHILINDKYLKLLEDINSTLLQISSGRAETGHNQLAVGHRMEYKAPIELYIGNLKLFHLVKHESTKKQNEYYTSNLWCLELTRLYFQSTLNWKLLRSNIQAFFLIPIQKIEHYDHDQYIPATNSGLYEQPYLEISASNG